MKLLLKKYEPPPSTHPESLIARHEAALFAELLVILSIYLVPPTTVTPTSTVALSRAANRSWMLLGIASRTTPPWTRKS